MYILGAVDSLEPLAMLVKFWSEISGVFRHPKHSPSYGPGTQDMQATIKVQLQKSQYSNTNRKLGIQRVQACTR